MSATAPGPELRFDRPVQIRAGLIAAAFVALFWHLLDFMPPDLGTVAHRWIHELDWSHGPIIPLFSAYLVYLRWDQIKRAPVRHTWVGFVIMLASLAIYQWSLWGVRIGIIRPLAMMSCLFGVIVWLRGLPVMRYAWVSWVYLFFAIPLPKRIYFELTDPLRRIAAVVATSVLGLFDDLIIERVGSVIEFIYKGVPGSIGVADACSGMRSTITLCAIGVAVAFISDRAWWQRVIMIVACVPIAVFCNFIRVTTTCWLHIFVGPEYAEGTPHTAMGLLVFLLAFGIFSALGWVLSNLTVDDPDPEPGVQ